MPDEPALVPLLPRVLESLPGDRYFLSLALAHTMVRPSSGPIGRGVMVLDALLLLPRAAIARKKGGWSVLSGQWSLVSGQYPSRGCYGLVSSVPEDRDIAFFFLFFLCEQALHCACVRQGAQSFSCLYFLSFFAMPSMVCALPALPLETLGRQ